MSSPSPFNIGRATGTSFAESFRKSRDEGAIESILSNAMQTGDPAALQQSIGQILSQVSPERQGPAIQYLQNSMQNIQQRQQQEAQRKAALQAGLNPDLPQALQVEQFKQKAKSQRIKDAGLDGTPQIAPPSSGISPQATEGVEPKKTGLQAMSDDQIVRLTGHPDKEVSEPAKAEQKRRIDERKIEQRNLEAKAKRHGDISSETLKKAEEVAIQIPIKRSALSMMNNSIANKDLSFWSRDNLAEATGIEGLRSPEGAVFKTAGKEYLLGNISRAGARPNQWIEQQIADMLTKVGRSAEANLSVTRALENELDLDEKRVALTNQIADELEEKLGYVPRDLGSRVNKELQSYAEKKQKELFNDLKAIKSIGENVIENFEKVEKGTPISLYVARSLLLKTKGDKDKARKEAEKLGYAY